MRMSFLVMLILCIYGNAWAGQSDSSTTMNGYSAHQYGDFEKKWRLVTVRYRKDTDEMRFTYANPIAWKTLVSGKINYPDGSVFAKVGVMTIPDSAFLSSVTPGGARRIQLMVRDQKKHISTDGWGYAIFDSQGKTLPGDQKTATQACFACHRIVPERGEVFSQIMPSAFGDPLKTDSKRSSRNLQRIEFANRNASLLPAGVRAHLPKEKNLVRVTTTPLGNFFGTLDEIQPTLAHESMRSGLPTVLISDDGKLFSLVFPDTGTSSCDASKKEIAFKGAHSLPKNDNSIYENSFCL
jgi:hypothetical protein